MEGAGAGIKRVKGCQNTEGCAIDCIVKMSSKDVWRILQYNGLISIRMKALLCSAMYVCVKKGDYKLKNQ